MKYLIERTVAGEYLNRNGSTTADANTADLYVSVNDAFAVADALNRGAEVAALIPVTESRTLGTPIT